MRNIALLVILGFAFWVSGCSKNAQQPASSTAPLVVQSATTASQQVASGTSVAVAKNTAGTSSQPENATAQSGVYFDMCALQALVNNARRKGGGTAEDRKGVAERITKVADNHLGPGVVFVSAAGDKSNYLLLAAAPGNEKSLRFFGAKVVETRKDRAELCADGFDEIQFIVRYDDGMNQRLVKRVRLDFNETERYMSQTTGARPVQ